MLFGLLSLTWYDIIPVILSIISVVLVQLINTTAQLLQTDEKTSIISNSTTNGHSLPKAEGTNGTTTTTTPSTSPVASPISHKKLEKQLSDFVLEEKNHTQAARSQTLPPTPSTPNSLQSFNSFDANDEYNEDEDTLSLDNLFPCDQTEIYASKEISYIIDELIQTEMNYVNNLRKGLQNYGEIYLREDAPEALKSMEKQQQILNNTADILELHEKHILPMMIKNQYDLKQMFDEFGQFIEKNHFYCYVIFTMNKKASMQLRQEHREWFLNYQSEIKDKLGIDSFLVQPIQRLTRYPLLLQQFISKFYKSHINCKPVLMSLCKLETRMRRLLQVVNQAEELPSIEELQEIELSQLGNFRKATEFDAYHFRSRKKYRAKVFLFDRCLLCAELRKKRLSYRQHYLWDSIEMQLNNAKNVKILVKAAAVSNGSAGVSNGSSKSAKEELELSTIEGVSIKQWLLFVQKVVEDARRDAKESTAFTLPTEIVLCIVFVLWALWHIL